MWQGPGTGPILIADDCVANSAQSEMTENPINEVYPNRYSKSCHIEICYRIGHPGIHLGDADSFIAFSSCFSPCPGLLRIAIVIFHDQSTLEQSPIDELS